MKISVFIFFSIFLYFNFLKSDNHDYIMKGPLAGSLYYTDKKPGRWKDSIDSHRPIISKKGNQLTVTTNHEMRGFEHYIIKHIILDKEFNIISEILFDPSKSIASSSHDISGYSEKIFVLSICNQHDTWLNYISLK